MSHPSSPSSTDRRIALGLAKALIPGTDRIPGADDPLVSRTEELLHEFSPASVRAFRIALKLLNANAFARSGRPFDRLSATRQEELLRSWERGHLLRAAFSLVSFVYKLVHFDEPQVYAAMGGRSRAVTQLDEPRWLERVQRAETWPAEEEIECDVVVVGTGAGGAVVGRELADRGYAVVFVEKGEHYRRDAFDGSSVAAMRRFYGTAAAVGNMAMPVFYGQLVGGSTAVNGGTSFRTPSWVLDRWCEDMGTEEFAPDRMARFFDRVEQVTEVAPAGQPEVGPIGKVFADGCQALRWSHAPIRRNTRACDGSGFCDFGCRSEARRSTDVSYIPAALRTGGLLLTGLRAERVLIENGRAAGLEAATKTGRQVRVRARAVLLAAGALATPFLLWRQGLGDRSGQVGRNLTLHPSTGISGLFDDEIRGWRHIPQGHCCDEFLRQGELLIASQPDVNIAAQLFSFGGRRLMDVLDAFAHVASVGVLVADATTGGRLLFEARGRPVIKYSLTRQDCDRLHSGMVHAMDMLIAAGAKRLWPSLWSVPVLELGDVERFRGTRVGASDFGLVSYHPLGTCRMGKDPRTSVVGLDHQMHDVRGLYVVDASTVPGPLGVNPQITIMAMATRAAELIADALA